MIRKINKRGIKTKKYDGPMDAAMKYLGGRARTVRETERFLDQCEYGEVEIDDAVNRLRDLKLLDDETFCREFIASRLRSKPISRRHLTEQLMAHEADKDAIEAALSDMKDNDETANARLIAEKYLRQFASIEEPERTRRVRARLMARGFSGDTIREVIKGSDDIGDWD